MFARPFFVGLAPNFCCGDFIENFFPSRGFISAIHSLFFNRSLPCLVGLSQRAPFPSVDVAALVFLLTLPRASSFSLHRTR